MLRTRSILSALVVATLAGAAQADPVTFTWAPTSSANLNWSNASNWTNNGSLPPTAPGNGDIVVIPNDADGQPVLNISVSPASVEVQNGATLYIGYSTNPANLVELVVGSAAGLKVNSGGTVDAGQNTSNFYARIKLQPAGSGTVLIDDGTVLLSSNAELRLNATGVTATLGGSGSIDNHGKMRSVDGTLVFGSGVVITDNAGSQRYVADGSGAMLRFARAHAGLAGDFFVANSGSLDFLASIYTAGSFNASCSSVTTGVGVTFTYDDGLSECP